MIDSGILITYASRSGSTAEIAAALGKSLSQNGVQVVVLPMHDVTDITMYQAVLVGSPIRDRAWLPEAIQFVQAHRSELARKPIATFTVCITLAMSNSDQYRRAVTEWIAPVRALVKPVSEGLFAGRLDFSRLPLNWDTVKLRTVVALRIFPKEDRRDWHAIQSWAQSLQPLLLQ